MFEQPAISEQQSQDDNMVSMNAECTDGYKANRWTKEINGKNFDRFYIDSPDGEKLGSFELNRPVIVTAIAYDVCTRFVILSAW